MNDCLICGDSNASVQAYNIWNYFVDCRKCGRYIITDEAKYVISHEDDKRHKLGILMRERAIKGKSPIALFQDYPTQDA